MIGQIGGILGVGEPPRAADLLNREAERNELRRCYFIDLPAPDPVIGIEPGCFLRNRSLSGPRGF
jgi:hypothetical protein